MHTGKLLCLVKYIYMCVCVCVCVCVLTKYLKQANKKY